MPAIAGRSFLQVWLLIAWCCRNTTVAQLDACMHVHMYWLVLVFYCSHVWWLPLHTRDLLGLG
jgi:hypothetical protein